MSIRFSAGTRLRAVETFNELVEGNIYTVKGDDNDPSLGGYIYYFDGLTQGYFGSRFEVAGAEPQSSAVYRPNHYARYAIEPITFIHENKLPFMVGNVVKYVMRYDAKDGLQDLQKAKRYLEMLIASEEGRKDWSA